MKFEIEKVNLAAALSVSAITAGKGATKPEGNYLFRLLEEDKVEILSFVERSFSSSLAEVEVSEGKKGDMFSVEADRLDRWVAAVPSPRLTLASKGGETQLLSPKSKAHLPSLDPKSFNLWDGILKDAKVKGRVAPATLSRAIASMKPFVSKDDTTNPELTQVELKNGELRATDRRAVAAVLLPSRDPNPEPPAEGEVRELVPTLADTLIRLAKDDLGRITSFLDNKRTLEDPEIEVLVSERAEDKGGGVYTIFRRSDGCYLGAANPVLKFPELSNIDREDKCPIRISIATEEFNSAINLLLSTAPAGEGSVTFVYRKKETPSLQLAMDGTTVGEACTYDLETAEVTFEPGVEWESNFKIDFGYLRALDSFLKIETLDLGVQKRGKGGFISLRVPEKETGNDYYSIVVWKR